MLDCCRPLAEIEHTGIILPEFACLAKCNGLKCKVFRADEAYVSFSVESVEMIPIIDLRSVAGPRRSFINTLSVHHKCRESF